MRILLSVMKKNANMHTLAKQSVDSKESMTHYINVLIKTVHTNILIILPDED